MDLNHIMGHGYPEMIASRLGADNLERMPRFINKGISGDTATGILARWESDALAYAPSVISLLAGINDAHGDLARSAREVADSYLGAVENILNKTKEFLPSTLFILCEPFYLDVLNQDAPYRNIPHARSEADFKFGNAPRDAEKTAQIQARLHLMQAELPALAGKYGALYVPLQDVFDAASTKTSPSYLIWDNLHPTMVGHRLIADRWLDLAESAFASR